MRLAAVAGALGVLSYGASFAVDEFWYTYSPLGRTGVMLAGAALALVLVARPVASHPTSLSPRVLDLLAGIALAAFSLYVLVGYETYDPGVRWAGVPLATACAAYLIWFGYVRTEGPVRALLTLPALTLVGRVSYSLYLWHIAPVLVLDRDIVDLPGPLLGVLGVAFAVVMTALSYRFLEKPFLTSRGAALAARAPDASAAR